MARKRAKEKQSRQSLFSESTRRYLVIFVIFFIIVLVSVFALTTQKDSSPSDQSGRWLFAMDTDNIQYKYSVSGIPTLVVIDQNGNVVYYNQGVHSKDQLMSYIESVFQGTAESLGEAPDFTVTTFNNEEFTLSEHRDEVVLLDVMGVGCPPCEMQMPELQKIKQEKGEEITILSVDVYYSGETKEDVIDTYGQYIKE